MALKLTKRYNLDGTISVLGYKGTSMVRTRDLDRIASFLEGYAAGETIVWNRPIVTKPRKNK